MGFSVVVIEGDITQEPADALITAINSGGNWLGGIDGAIARVAGPLFHQQAAQAAPLKDGQTVLATSAAGQHNGQFRNVLFVVDDLELPLRKLVLIALRAADAAGLRRVTLPAIRTGMAIGRVEANAQVAVQHLCQAVKEFETGHPRSVVSVRFVIRPGSQMAGLLRRRLEETRG